MAGGLRFLRCWLGGLTIVALVLSACAPRQAALPPPPDLLRPPPAPRVAVGGQLAVVRGPIPYPFEANVGQAAERFEYLLRAGDLHVGFETGGLTYALSGKESGGRGERWSGDRASVARSGPVRRWTVRQELVGAAQARPVGSARSDTAINYLIGPPDAWKLDVPAFHQVTYPEAWPGITVAYERAGAGVKSSYHLAPGADPGQIRVAYRGGEPRLAEDQSIEVLTPLGVLRESAPVAWQDGPDGRQPVAVRWAMLEGAEEAEVGFQVGPYDPARPLVIDPTVLYASFLGGSAFDVIGEIAVDASGAVYVAGITQSTQATFPDGDPNNDDLFGVPGFDQTFNGAPGTRDAFAAKLSPDGQTLVYATYIGGSGNDHGQGIAVGGDGSAYLAGETSSTEATFPIGSGIPGVDQFQNGGQDAFVVKLAPDGRSLVYATYVGGGSSDGAKDIAVNGAGEAYILGETSSSEATFPDGDPNANDQIDAPGFDRAHNGLGDAYVIKLAANGGSLLYATYIGGSGSEYVSAIALDSFGAAYVVGQTSSTQATFPDGDPNNNDQFDAPGFDRTFNGGAGDFDAFAAKLAPNGQTLVYATYLGGNNVDVGYGVAVDSNGYAYVTGYARSTQATFPNGTGLGSLTPAVTGFDQSHNGDTDGYVVKLTTDGTSLVYATYIGGAASDQGSSIAVDAAGVAYVAGFTDSTETTFPNGAGFGTGAGQVNVPGFDQTHNGDTDAFVVKLAPNGLSLLDATYFGGSLQDQGLGMAIDANGHVYVVGGTRSTEANFPDGDPNNDDKINFPGFDRTQNGDLDGFVVGLGPEPSFTAVASASPTSAPPGSTVAITANVTSATALSVVVDVEVHDAANNKVFQWYDEHVTFAAGQTRTFLVSWPVPASAPTGAYRVQVGVFSVDWAAEYAYNSNAATVAVAPATGVTCTPRPNVRLATRALGGGQMEVTLSAQANPGSLPNGLEQLTLGTPRNGQLSLNGAAISPGSTVSLGGAATATFVVTRQAPGQPTTVPFTVHDRCGAWPTFVGGGPNAF